MGLILIDREDKRIESVIFNNLDMDNDMGVNIEFADKNKESLTIYLKRSHVEALKRHVDYELDKINQQKVE